MLDIRMGQVLSDGDAIPYYGMGEIYPDSTIDILYDIVNGTLEFIVDGNPKGITVQKDSLKKGVYYLSAMWMQDDDYIQIINP